MCFDHDCFWCSFSCGIQRHLYTYQYLYLQVERDVTNLMLKALKYCDSHDTTEVMRQYRAATIHHRLASLFHNSYRNSVVWLLFADSSSVSVCSCWCNAFPCQNVSTHSSPIKTWTLSNIILARSNIIG